MRTKLIALLMLLFFCIGGAFAQVPAQVADDWYQNKPIRTVTFEGLKNVKRTELDGLFASYLGKKFNDELYWDILQKLYALEYFETIQPVALPGDAEHNSVQLKFTVTEKPVVRNIKFVGNQNQRTSELLDKVALKEGDVYNEMKSRLDERTIRDYYLEKGYANVKVVSEVQKNDDASLTLYFNITEGKQTVISKIAFEGNNVMASKTLQGLLILKEAKLFTAGTFRESDLEADKVKIRNYYRERGYIDAVVESVVRDIDTTTSPEKNLLKLTFVIKEGNQYTYGGTIIEGNHIFTTAELLGKIRIKDGDVMNQTRFDEGFQMLADTYFENGYTSNYINKQEKRDTDRKRISYVITIVESERSHIEHIIIKGNTKTKDKVILREFSLEPGDIFSKSKLIDSIRNLYNLRYFSTVAPDLQEGSEKNLVDVIVTVEEQSTASLQFGITYSGVTDADTFPLSVFIQWEEKNFMGNGQTISANATMSFDTQSVTLGYAENWFLGSPLTVNFDLSATHQILSCYQDSMYPVFGDTYYDDNGIVPDPYTTLKEYQDASSLDDAYKMKYEHYAFSLGASTGYRWIPKFAIVTLRGGVKFSVVRNAYDDTIYRPADKDIREQHGDWGWVNSVWTKLSLDQRDVNYDPNKGWFLSEQLSYYGLIPVIESDYYLRSDTKLEAYATLLNIPINDTWNFKLIVAGFSTFSFQVPVLADNSIGDSNKLYIDGMFNGRGWTAIYSSVKGNVLLNHSLEIRIPIIPGVAAFDIFGDAAAIKSDLVNLNTLSLNDYYFSFGPGIRLSIQQFPLRFMLANRFRVQDGKFEWKNGTGPDWSFVLSFNIANL